MVVLSYCRTVPGIPIHPPILTPKPQPDIPSHSPMDGRAGLSMGFSHVPTRGVPPNLSVPSRPIVPWMDGLWDCHMSHPQVSPKSQWILTCPDFM